MPFDPTALRTAAEAPGWDEAPPPDTYEAELIKAEVFAAKSNGSEWLRLGWKVLSGRLVDHEWSHIQTLERYKPDGEDNEMALSITARILSTLGIDIAAIQTADDLPRQLATVRGQAYAVEVKRNGNFINTTPKNRLASYQPSMPGTGYGETPAQSAQSAIYQGDGPAQAGGLLTQEQQPSRLPEPTGESDVPGPKPGEFVHPEPPPQKGDIDPATGEAIPF